MLTFNTPTRFYSDSKILNRFFVSVFLGVLSLVFSYKNSASTEECVLNQCQVYFDVPAQSLKSALLEFALQADVEILSSSDLISELRSSPIIGSFPARDALERLLSNTSLKPKRLDKNSWVLLANVSAKANSDAPNKIVTEESFSLTEEVYVSASRYPFRYTTITESIQRANGISVFDSARFLNVVPKQFIIDQQSSDLTDVLKHISGITPGDGLADSNDDFFIRGFARDSLYIDGFRLDSNTGIKISPASIEKIETIKGPSTVFYGQAEPGGTVNVIRKLPQAESKHSVRGVFGSYEQSGLEIDLTGTVFGKKDLLFRSAYIMESFDEQRDLVDVGRHWLSTSLKKYFSNETSFDLRVEHNQSSSVRDQGLLLLIPDSDGIKIIAVDQERPTRQARREFQAEQNVIDLSLTHLFDTGWKSQARYAHLEESRSGIRTQNNVLTLTGLLATGDDLAPGTEIRELTGISLDGTTTVVPIPVNTGTELVSGDDMSLATLLSVYDEKGRSETDFVRFDIGGAFDAFNMKHRMNVGAEFYREVIRESFLLERRTDIKTLLFNDAGGEVGVVDDEYLLGDLLSRQQEFTVDEYGFFIQDSVDITNALILSVGTRYTLTEGVRRDLVSATINRFATYEELSSQLGVAYKPKDFISFYANYSESMEANYQLDDVGTDIPEPELSSQVELGVKLFLSDRLIASAGIFDIKKENMVDVQFVEGFRRSVLGGRQDVTGFDINFSYRLSSKTDVVGAASWLNGNIVSGENAGNRPALTSRYTASMFVNHQFAQDFLRGWQLSFGGQVVGDRYGNDENTILINGYGVLDIGLSYGWGDNHTYVFRVDIKNVSDENYFTSVEEGIRFNRGAGRTIKSSISFEF